MNTLEDLQEGSAWKAIATGLSSSRIGMKSCLHWRWSEPRTGTLSKQKFRRVFGKRGGMENGFFDRAFIL